MVCNNNKNNMRHTKKQAMWPIHTETVFERTCMGEGNGTPLQYSCLDNPMGGGAWWAAVHGVAKSRTWLSDFTFTLHFPALEKEMATHSSVLAWRIPGKGEPGGLLSMGSHRVGDDWSDLAAAAAATPLLKVLFSIVLRRKSKFLTMTLKGPACWPLPSSLVSFLITLSLLAVLTSFSHFSHLSAL